MSAAKASSPKILVRIIKCSSSISPQRGEPTPGRYCQDVARAADWYRAYCAAGCFPPRCEQKARKVTLRRPLVGSAEKEYRMRTIFPYTTLFRSVARAADWYRAYCAAGCFPPRCEQKARKVTLRRPLVGSAEQ